MTDFPKLQPPPKIEFIVAVSLQGPIAPGNYTVEGATINVSYPNQVELGFPSPIKLPAGVSTLFIVSWLDTKGKTQSHLTSKSFERNLPIYFALDLISKLLMAFKLVRIGHSDGMRIRTIGISDTLFYTSQINGVPTGNLNIGIRLNKIDYPWLAKSTFDSNQTTALATPHIDAETYLIARRYVRCFELEEHGFYKETVIVAHAILDDIVQDIIQTQLRLKGLDNEQSRELLVRAIKESMLRIYLGPLLKILEPF